MTGDIVNGDASADENVMLKLSRAAKNTLEHLIVILLFSFKNTSNLAALRHRQLDPANHILACVA
ncbi:MAG: hypothetical protein ACTFAK_10245 [Candidatus Electronema sp. VV]